MTTKQAYGEYKNWGGKHKCNSVSTAEWEAVFFKLIQSEKKEGIMIYVILYLVGSVLFVNGLLLLGIVQNLPGVAALNLLVGVSIAIMALYIGMTDMLKAFGDTVSNTATATVFTFALAYMMIAIEVWTQGDFTTIGWYSLIMSVCLFFLSLGLFNFIGKTLPKVPQFGILWLLWAIAFFLFFLRFALGMPIAQFAGWYVAAIGIITCSYPALANFQAGKVGKW